jgi:hypothetical protein
VWVTPGKKAFFFASPEPRSHHQKQLVPSGI